MGLGDFFAGVTGGLKGVAKNTKPFMEFARIYPKFKSEYLYLEACSFDFPNNTEAMDRLMEQAEVVNNLVTNIYPDAQWFLNEDYKVFFSEMETINAHLNNSHGALFENPNLNNNSSFREWPNGDKYIGEWDHNTGILNGYGTYTWSNGDVYEGDFVNGSRTGNGRYIWINGEVYEGEFLNDQRHGYGIHHHVDGRIYEGHWVNNLKNGYGKETQIDGWGQISFEGEWMDDKANGKGRTLRYPVKTTWGLDDEYINWNFHEGEYVDGLINGEGKMTWLDGDEYVGGFDSEQRCGLGKMIFANGDIYDGNWTDDSMNGIGKMSYKNGDIEEGEWENGSFLGVRQIKTNNQLIASSIEIPTPSNTNVVTSNNTSPAQNTLSKEDRLKELFELKNKGFIDDEEFKEMKRNIIMGN